MEGGLWKQPGSSPRLPLSGVDTGQALSLPAALFSPSGKMGRMPTSWNYHQVNLMISAIKMDNSSGTGNYVQAPPSDCRAESLVLTLKEAPVKSSVYRRVREIKYLAHGPPASNWLGWQSNLGSWSPECTLLAMILSCLNSSAHSLLISEVQVKEKHAGILF